MKSSALSWCETREGKVEWVWNERLAISTATLVLHDGFPDIVADPSYLAPTELS